MIDNFGGRKFVAFIICMAIIIGISAVMLINKWLTAENCMKIIGDIVLLSGIYAGGNAAEYYFKRGGSNGLKGNSETVDSKQC